MNKKTERLKSKKDKVKQGEERKEKRRQKGTTKNKAKREKQIQENEKWDSERIQK